MKNEERFKGMLAIALKKHRATWVNIPDTKMINARNRHLNREDKRPFDGVIIAPMFVLCVELKFGYNQLEDHQKATGRAIEDTNNMYVVLRMVERPKHLSFRAENTDKETLFESDELNDFVYKLIQYYS